MSTRRRIRRYRQLRALVLLAAVTALVTGAVVAAAPGSPLRSVVARLAGIRSAASSSAGQAIDPGYFASGSCMAFPPTHGDRNLTVFLDAGHGGIDPGAVGTTETGQTIYEADQTLPIELDTMADLRAQGYRVVVSRTRDSTVLRLGPGDTSDGALTVQGVHDEVAARDVCANKAKANILIGIYMDSGSSPYNAGCVTGYDAVRPFAAENLKLATLVQRDVLDAMNAKGWDIPDEGVVQDEYLGSSLTAASVTYGHLLLLGPADPGWFSTPSEMPGALIEPLFITDPFEGSIALSTTGREVIAGGLTEAVDQYFGVSPSTDTGAGTGPAGSGATG